MGLLDFFSGGSPEKYEQKADAFVIKKAYGHAKIEYEKALERLGRQSDGSPGQQAAIADKLRRCKEALAREHRKNGLALVEAGCADEARELFNLALELTNDDRLSKALTTLLETTPNAPAAPVDQEVFEAYFPEEEVPGLKDPGSDEEYFEALCNALEETERDAYQSYPATFKKGFIALNRGDFDTAVAHLSEAAKAYPFGANHIALELATAHLNRGEHEAAQALLEGFLQEYPDSLKAYYLMCDLLWERDEFAAADQLLADSPPELADSLPLKLLAGETLLRSQQFEQAVAFYRELLADRGWEPQAAQSLAEALEALGRHADARQLYGELISACTGCGARVDPHIKQRFAETSFAAGDFSTRILELYLDLVREDPPNRGNYYDRISQLYSLQENETESHRFKAFARRAAEEDRG